MHHLPFSELYLRVEANTYTYEPMRRYLDHRSFGSKQPTSGGLKSTLSGGFHLILSHLRSGMSIMRLATSCHDLPSSTSDVTMKCTVC